MTHSLMAATGEDEPGGYSTPRPSEASDDAVWDDAAFRQRVRDLATTRGVPLGEALEEAGLSESWLRHHATKGRQVDALLRLARSLKVDPAVLMGLRPMSAAAGKHDAADPFERMAIVAHLAAHVYVALDREQSDRPEDILDAFRNAMGWPSRSADRRQPSPRRR